MPTYTELWVMIKEVLLPNDTDILRLFVIKGSLPWPTQYTQFSMENTYTEFSQNPRILDLLDPWILDKLNSGTFKTFSSSSKELLEISLMDPNTKCWHLYFCVMENLFSCNLNCEVNSFCPKGMQLPITMLMFWSTDSTQTAILRKCSMEKSWSHRELVIGRKYSNLK